MVVGGSMIVVVLFGVRIEFSRIVFVSRDVICLCC